MRSEINDHPKRSEPTLPLPNAKTIYKVGTMSSDIRFEESDISRFRQSLPYETLENKVRVVGQEIFRKTQEHKFSLFKKSYWASQLMDWSMQYKSFKIEMFRFVDVLPSLNTTDQIIAHLKEYFLRDDVEFPAVMKSSLKTALSVPGAKHLVAKVIKANVTQMAHVFIAGEDGERALSSLKELWNDGYLATVDILGEAVLSEDEAIDYQKKYISLVEDLSAKVNDWKGNEDILSNSLGPIPKVNVSVKCSSLFSQADPLNFEGSIEGIAKRLRPILKCAVELGAFINLDMEDFRLKNITLALAEKIFTEADFADYPYFGVVIQAYLRSGEDDLQRIVDLAKRRQTSITVRLVKGAYWDTEVIIAKQNNWEIPVFTEKRDSDASYERLTELMLMNHPHILPAFASHNVRSLSYAMALADHLGIDNKDVEVQMLFGMADSFKSAVSSMGYRVREYVPVGEMLPGMAYLVRRLLENTANEGFLKLRFVGGEDANKLLNNPQRGSRELNV